MSYFPKMRQNQRFGQKSNRGLISPRQRCHRGIPKTRKSHPQKDPSPGDLAENGQNDVILAIFGAFLADFLLKSPGFRREMANFRSMRR
jgi:hypothetical protein